MDGLTIRPGAPSDRRRLRAAVVELHERERGLHNSRLRGEETADAYLDWMLAEAEQGGAVLVAEAGGAFAGFAAGWIAHENLIEETPDSNRYGYVSDICVLPPFRGRRIASALLEGAGGAPPPRRGHAHPAQRPRRQRSRAQGLRTFRLCAL